MTPADVNIKWFSPSSLAQFVGSPAAWYINYILKERSPTNPAMARGKAIETGVSRLLFTQTNDHAEAGRVALAQYDREMALSVADAEKKAKERAVITDSIAHAAAALTHLGVPEAPTTGDQHRIEIDIGASVPCIGFLDFRYPGTIVDLKSTLRIPSQFSFSHALQAAIYQAAHGNHQVQFCYVSPKRASVLTLTNEDAAYYLNAARVIAQKIEAFLATAQRPEDLTRTLTPDYSSFYFSDQKTRSRAAEVFGY